MLSEQNYKKWLFTSSALLRMKNSLVATCSQHNCLKQLQAGYGYLTHVLVIAVVLLVSFLGLSQQAQAHTIITKTTSTPTVAPGGTATYKIIVDTTGQTSDTTALTITDALPTGFTYLSPSSFTYVGGASRVTTVDPVVGSNTPVWGTFNELLTTPASSLSITFNALVPIGGTCGKYDNSVTATSTTGIHTYTPYTGTGTATAEDVTVTGTLSASKTTSTPTVVNTPTGTQATYTIVLTNTGQCTIPNASITDALPAGFTYLSTGAIGFTGGATRPTTTNPTAGATAPIWSNFTLPSGSTVSLTFTANIASSVVNGTYNNNASATTTTAGITVTPYVGTSSTQEDVTITSANLVVSKTASTPSVTNTAAGTQATYSLTVTNSGTAAATGVKVTDTLPAGFTYSSTTSITANGTAVLSASYTATGTTTPQWDTSPTGGFTINPGQTLVIVFNAVIPSTVADGTYNNSASTTSPNAKTITNFDGTLAGNTADNVVVKSANLTIAKTHTGNFTLGQSGATYTLTASNVGTGDTNGNVTVVDTLPTGLTATAASGTGWTCNLNTPSAGKVQCARSDVLVAGSSYPAIILTVDVGLITPVGTNSITNSATVSGGGEIITTNNTATNPTTVNSVSDLTITKSHTGNFTQGQTGATYTLTAKNSGTFATSGTVSVVDTLPTGLTATAISGTGWTCTLSTLTCTRSDVLAAGSSYPAITLTVNVAANASASITNNATVSGGGEVTTTNNSATDPTTVNGVSDLTITKTHTGSFIQGQTGASYNLTAKNSGTAATSGIVTVVDTLPTGLTATAASGSGWTCSLNTPSTGKVQCTRSDILAVGISYPAITLTVDVSASVPVGTNSITNSASVSGGGEINTTNNSATDPTTITALAVGGTFNYTITVTNDGPSTATNVQVTDRLPPVTDVLVNSASITKSQGSTVYNAATPNIVWTVGTLAPNASATLTIPATRLLASFTVNVAEVTASDQSDPDSIPGNNITGEDDRASVTVPSQSVDLAVTKTVNNPSPTLGQNVTFTITVTNPSSSLFTATGIGLSDLLPSGFTYQSNTSSQGSYTPGTGAWSVGSLSPGTTATLTITATVNTVGTITNTAQLSALDQTDTDPTNNSKSAIVTVVNLTPNLRLVKRITAINGSSISTVIDPTTTPDPNDNAPNWPVGYLKGVIDGGLVRPTDQVEYTIYFLSDGDSPTKRVQLCDLVPVNSTFIATTFNGLTPTDGGLPGADTGITLSIGSTAPTVYLSNVGGDGQDRGQFLAPNAAIPASCGTGANTAGAVVIDVVTDTTTPSTLPNATAPGIPTGSYGFIRFRALVK
jgi:uncharacterized repeat protein (TIGR01451 family)/fimbrial isopeptide formation D2 family protein